MGVVVIFVGTSEEHIAAGVLLDIVCTSIIRLAILVRIFLRRLLNIFPR